MVRYRRTLLVVAVVALSAGCLGFLTGTQALEFSANRTVVSDAALDETGYQEADNQTVRNVVNIGAAGQQRQVNLTSYFHAYNRSVDATDLNASRIDALGDGAGVPRTPGDGSGARTPGGGIDGDATVPVGNASGAVTFSVLAMPNARVAGQSVHPLSRLSTEQLVRRFAALGNSSVSFESNRTVESMGAERTVSTFRLEGGENGTDALVHVSTFEAGNDFVLVFAAHPALIDEQNRVDALITGLEQPSA